MLHQGSFSSVRTREVGGDYGDEIPRVQKAGPGVLGPGQDFGIVDPGDFSIFKALEGSVC